MLGMGIVAAAAAGLAWRSGQSTQAERSFRAEAISVGSTVTTAIRRMDDLTIATRTLMTSNPTLTNRQLGQWYQDAGVQGRYPGTLGFGFVQFVVEDQLPAYVAAVRADPVPAMKPIGDSLRLPPPGAAGGYCLIRLAVSHGLASLVPGGVTYDLCNVPGVGALLDPASASMSAISATMAPWGQILVVSVPVYRGHGTPTGAENRRARLRGWITGVFNVSAVLGSAVAGDSRLYVGVARQNPPSTVATYLPSTTSRLIDVASIGRKPDGARFTREFTLLADGAWTVTVSRPSGWGWLSPNDQGIAVFAGGTGATLLLFVLLQALTSGRARALRMVAEKTDELRHQALHDSLTGLPNRALLIDRTEQLLARSRREWIQPAAMFLDLDDFKSINDTFGHPVGDELLQAVGARISAALREPDTVGRLGGDEFLILVEGEPYSGGPELVAERLLNVLREPFQLTSLGAGSDPVEIGASIGIAVGARPHAEDLLRDADIALYEAKGDGKHRYSVFRAEMQAQLQGRRELEVDLQHALERDEFFLEKGYRPASSSRARTADPSRLCVSSTRGFPER